ncbi:hypothetical protein NQ117_05195 [Paenibacillus sp. SC116]|uniref:hypothetical protein n=1 Tax=Paenibacillus sp. SC116 TaxID=2968986 RepID=UPI00215B32F1|nr:hypothetical protein [Paenibacillus sp. SC116]MCR8843067.1 hypothetical protein [Paenibacillus sp. SC116]
MKQRQLLEFTVDISDPIAELSAVISAVLACHPNRQAEILHAIDEQIGMALAGIESANTDEVETEE